jgi:hypothetical protein
MNEVEFKNLSPIGNYEVRFKCFNKPDGYQATFHVNNKGYLETGCQIDFEISDTLYNSDINNSGKSVHVYIDEKYGSLEKCFEKAGYEYLEKKIKDSELKTEIVNLMNYLN